MSRWLHLAAMAEVTANRTASPILKMILKRISWTAGRSEGRAG
ncbi:MAG: hypothetical protein V8S27_01390 [Lachnospiraceae bacterium]